MLIFLNRNGLDCDRQRAVIRGGNWNNGANAGPFYANLNNGPSNVNNNIGFRCCNSLQARFMVFTEMMNSARRTTSIQIQAEKPNIIIAKGAFIPSNFAPPLLLKIQRLVNGGCWLNTAGFSHKK